MKTIGIIAEYNPFHNGHLYHINKIKEMYQDSILILVMSGNFTQRGEVAIIDKWKRCEIALKHGIDLVIELPYPFSTQSADFFSYGAITILEKLKVDKVIFGSESNDINTINTIAEVQVENDDLDKLVRIYSRMGKNYPTALSLAIEDLTGKRIDTPNDLLGVSYLKTILKNNYSIEAETIKRIGSFHDLELNGEFASAEAIREGLKNNSSIEKFIPEDTLSYYNSLHFMDEYFPILKYKLLTEEDLSIYHTVDEGIDKVLKKEIVNSTSYDEFIKRVKSKRYTYNKISRMLLHILCNFTKEKAKAFQEVKYIRILGLNSRGRKYLNTIKKEIELPIISKITKHKEAMLEFEITTTKIYDITHNDSLKKEQEKIIYIE